MRTVSEKGTYLMADGFSWRTNATQVAIQYRATSVSVFQRVKRAVINQQLILLRTIQNKLSDDVLHVRTGKLHRSIHALPVEASGSSVRARVASDGTAPYGRIHEYGGVIHHPGGTAYMYFGDSDGVRFISNAAAAKMEAILGRTRPHLITMPERSFMRSSLKERGPAIVEAVREAVVGDQKA